MSLEKWITSAAAGNKNAQQFLFEQFAKRSKMLCLRYVKNHEDADEILQDGFYKFFRSLPRFSYQCEAGVYAFIKKIMINECLAVLRKKKTYTLIAESELPDMPIDPGVFERMQAVEIDKMLFELPACYSTVFILFVMEDYDHKQIAEALQITENGSRTRLLRARLLLQKIFTSKDAYHAAKTK